MKGWPSVAVVHADYQTWWSSVSHEAWVQLDMTIRGNGTDPYFGGPSACDSVTTFWMACLTADPVRCPGGNLNVADYSVTVVDMDPTAASGLYSVDVPPDSPQLVEVYFKDDLPVTLSVSITWGYVPADDLGRSIEFFIRSEAVRAFPFPVAQTGGALKLDDMSEENDNMYNPRPLVRGAHNYPARVLLREEDWYLQPRGTNDALVFTILFKHEYGNLDLCVFNADTGVLIGCSTSSPSGVIVDKEAVNTEGVTVVDGWLVRVYGSPGTVTNSYDLRVSLPDSGGGGGGGGSCKCYLI